MKKLFTTIVLILLFAFPLGSSQSSLHEGKKIWTYTSYESVLKNRQKQLTCLAKNIYFEARNEPFAGQFAVALVTLNRVSDAAFPNTICNVVYQGIHDSNGFPKRDRCQFSWYCDGASDEVRNPNAFDKTQKIANLAMLQYSKIKLEGLDYTEGARFYHTYEISPSWSKTFPKIGRIGDHIFYR
jgi:spore germination cell wall hydrolase CwlJ-like protein